MVHFGMFLLTGFLLAGCGAEQVESTHRGRLFSVEVVDSAGVPMEGLEIGRVNHPAKWAQTTSMVPMTIGYAGDESGWVTIDIRDYYGNLLATVCDSLPCSPGATRFSWDAGCVRQGFVCTQTRFVPIDGEPRVDSQWTVMESAPDTTGCVMGTTDQDGMWATDDTLWFPCLLGNPPHARTWADTLSSYSYFCPVKKGPTDEPGGAAQSMTDLMAKHNANAYLDTITVVVRDPATTRVVTMDVALTKGANHFRIVW